MGLLDSVLGAALGGGNSNNSKLAVLLPIVMSMLNSSNNDGGVAGLGDLVSKFQGAGMGDIIGSWIGQGQNQAISGSQLQDVLGGDLLGQIAGQANLQQGETADLLSQVLPALIDRGTPDGQQPAGGIDTGALMGMLGGLLR